MATDVRAKAHRRAMPWSFKAAIAMFIVFALGAGLITFACVESGWEALRHFAWGLFTAAAGLIAGFIFSVICALTQPEWRRASIFASAASILLFGALLLFARSA
jgi:uncharacterized membrane protein